MVIGVLFSGIVAGISGVAWALAAGFPLLVALAFYPAVGLVGSLVFLSLLFRRMRDQDGFALAEVAQ